MFMFMQGVREVLSLFSGGKECVVCGSPCGALCMCKACKARIIKEMTVQEGQRRCPICGRRLLSESGKCMKCRGDGMVFSHTRTVLPLSSYRLWMRELLTDWKSNGEKSLTPFFAERIASAVRFLGDKVIVPVPPREGKMRLKGWDQMSDIAHYLKKQFTVINLLRRTASNQQKALAWENRLNMTKNSPYQAKTGFSLRLALSSVKGIIPRRVCIIDDVMTTGSTAESSARALIDIGVKEVDVVTLFTVD